MIPFFVDYASPSAFESDRERARLGFTADHKRPVRFVAGVKKAHRLGFRMALQALGELVWSTDEWMEEDLYRALILDPIITVHPDAVWFEAFSQDQSSYGLVRFDRSIFEPEGEVVTGTTNVDFTAWLHAALGEMRSSRSTTLSIEPQGFGIATRSFGGRFEKKVEVPEGWIRGLLSLQQAMAMPGTRLSVRPVDLLAAIRFLKHSKAKISPRALRYELVEGQDARLVLEPWEQVVPLVGAHHGHKETRVIRTWGRRRLRLIEPILPYADRVTVYLKGRALPHFYAVEWQGEQSEQVKSATPAITFVLGLSGWTENRFSQSGGLGLLGGGSNRPPPFTEDVLAALKSRVHANVEALATELGRSPAEIALAADHLVKAGRVMFDLERREYRHRELFDRPIDLSAIFPEDPRAADARRLVTEQRFAITSAVARETKKQRRLKTPDGPVERELIFRDWQVVGTVDALEEVEVVVSQEGRIIYGRCGCTFFKENLLNRGPCEHLLALFLASEAARRDLPSSIAAEPRQKAPVAETSESDDVDGEALAEDNDE